MTVAHGFHGTNTRFALWVVPPPAEFKDRLNAAHSAVFLTRHLDFAQGAGLLTCEAMLRPDAKVLVPAMDRSDKLRQALLKHPIAGRCVWLQERETWRQAWNTGEATRFGADPKFLAQFHARAAASLQRQAPNLHPDVVSRVAANNITRGWIETVVGATRVLGYDALQGHECDKPSEGPSIARPWLAVLSAEALTEPVWR